MASPDLSRLKQLFRRAAAGEELTLGFFGGSITQGSLAAEQGNCYAFRVYQWFVDTFPGARFHYVNGGIGGTDWWQARSQSCWPGSTPAVRSRNYRSCSLSRPR